MLGATASAASTPASRAHIDATTSWTVYHGDPQGSGIDTSGVNFSNASLAWTSPVLDGQVYGEPLESGGRVYVATENDTVYALAAETGAVLWSTSVGPAVPDADVVCGDISPQVGITGTPVIDVARGRDLRRGRRAGRWCRGPRSRRVEHVHGSPGAQRGGRSARRRTGLPSATNGVEPRRGPRDLRLWGQRRNLPALPRLDRFGARGRRDPRLLRDDGFHPQRDRGLRLDGGRGARGGCRREHLDGLGQRDGDDALRRQRLGAGALTPARTGAALRAERLAGRQPGRSRPGIVTACAAAERDDRAGRQVAAGLRIEPGLARRHRRAARRDPALPDR